MAEAEQQAAIPCHRTLGHGETCSEGHLCDSCTELLRLRAMPTPARSEDWKALRMAKDTKAWSDEDITWLERLKPEIMRPVAKRYGRACMDLVIRGGVIGHGFERLMASRPPDAMRATMTIMAMHVNYLMERALVAAGVSPQLFTSCQEDLDRLAVLNAGAPGCRR